MSYGINYNGQTEKEIGLVITKRPAVPSTERIYKVHTIPGRNGKIYESEDCVEDIKIEISMGLHSDEDSWMEKYRNSRRWLLKEGNHKLILSDDSEYFYKVKSVTIGKVKRNYRKIGEFVAVFTCDGYQYLISGENEYSKKDVSYNPYEKSCPIYILVGEGVCDLCVNGKTMKANISGNLTIDTERMISYREDGTLKNTSVKGNYEELYLLPGDNTIEITDGFSLSVIPNWRCF